MGFDGKEEQSFFFSFFLTLPPSPPLNFFSPFASETIFKMNCLENAESRRSEDKSKK